ncbi:MAG TPA: GspE/PulE family protein [Gammaproteobacteria bacterium]
MSTPLDRGESFAAFDQSLLQVFTGTEIEIELFDGRRRRGRLEDWHPEDGNLELCGGGEAGCIPLRDIRCIQLDGHLAGAPTQTDYRSFAIRFRDGERLEGMCLECARETQGVHLCTEASDGSPRRLFLPQEAIAWYQLAGEARQWLLQAPGLEDADAVSLTGELVLRDSVSLRARLEQGESWRAPVELPAEVPETLRLAHQLDIPILSLRHFDIDPQVMALVSEEIARRYTLIPLLHHRGRLVVAMAQPADEEVLRLLRFITGFGIEPCLATAQEIETAIQSCYGAGPEALMEGLASDTEEEAGTLREAERLGTQKPIVQLVNNLILDALRRGASDIHIRPDGMEAELLFRIDGLLQPVRRFGKSLLPAMVARIKVLGKMDISDRRLPQDGQARMLDGDETVDLRISTIPTVGGESVAIRLLCARTGMKPLSDLGLEPRDLQRLEECLQRSHGLLLVTGPTGAGKSTTLYAALREIRQRAVNIVTVEDPVEYRLGGMGQIQVNRVPGYGFARALKHILRHDPDVIMIGEIRDRETARIAIESALTGHLVLSTLHTNDAISAVSRLVDMGIEPYLVASALNGVIAQRLVRCNCPRCIAPEPLARHILSRLRVTSGEDFRKGAGCERCNHSGYQGRAAVYELLMISPELRRLIVQGASVDEMRMLALEQGLRPLTQHALRKARAGITSLEEVYRVRLE